MKYILIICMILCFCVSSYAYQKEIKVDWEYVSEEAVNGYKLYQQIDDEFTLIQDISGGELRTWSGEVDLIKGENLFVLTAYTDDTESVFSSIYPFNFAFGLSKPIVFTVTCN